VKGINFINMRSANNPLELIKQYLIQVTNYLYKLYWQLSRVTMNGV